MNFYEFWKALNADEQQAFADECGLSVNYIGNQLIYRNKSPRLGTLEKMAKASKGVFSYHDLCDFFKPAK
ncbi:hypothetical protein AAX06_09955 [Moraxella bovoculi]|uniref:Uncharacterized protein n=1 Tax=Moraxella bovoculi TaxID=386891 RepID=A0AAC8PWR2_9GAMM|nr:helix-turn-helix transcriptional regulator [Moraxella bovoculi]AKG08410.1 hypothetical protein AAX06_09955 [Moraxella bovoculi]